MSRHMWRAFTGFVAKGTLFISCMIARTLNGRQSKGTPVSLSTAGSRITVRKV